MPKLLNGIPFPTWAFVEIIFPVKIVATVKTSSVNFSKLIVTVRSFQSAYRSKIRLHRSHAREDIVRPKV